MSVPERRPIFLSPHFDDAALSCGGTLVAMADSGDSPLILTIFGGEPGTTLNPFAEEMHRWWGLAPEDVLTHRRQEEACAADILGVESDWLDLPDAIYRGNRYLSDEHLFGAVYPDEATFFRRIRDAVCSYLRARSIDVSAIYCPVGIGNHVDHQLVLAAARTFTYRGHTVVAWEDFPYVEYPGVEPNPVARRRSSGQPELRVLSGDQLERKIRAVNCYGSQHEMIFRDLGAPADVIAQYAHRVGDGRPAERFWPLSRPPGTAG